MGQGNLLVLFISVFAILNCYVVWNIELVELILALLRGSSMMWKERVKSLNKADTSISLQSVLLFLQGSPVYSYDAITTATSFLSSNYSLWFRYKGLECTLPFKCFSTSSEDLSHWLCWLVQQHLVAPSSLKLTIVLSKYIILIIKCQQHCILSNDYCFILIYLVTFGDFLQIWAISVLFVILIWKFCTNILIIYYYNNVTNKVYKIFKI